MQCTRPAFRHVLRCLAPFLCTVVGVALQSPRACADGVMFTTVGRSVTMVASPRQRSAAGLRRRQIQVTLRTSFRAGTNGRGWVIPVPRRPEHVAEADVNLFGRLEELTAPQFFVEKKRAVSTSVVGVPAYLRAVGRVVVAEIGKAGIFDYTVLTATGTTALREWLGNAPLPRSRCSKAGLQGLRRSRLVLVGGSVNAGMLTKLGSAASIRYTIVTNDAFIL